MPASARNLQVTVASSGDELAALAPAWRTLFDAAGEASPFQSPAWLLSWLSAFRPAEPFSLAAWDGDALVGLLPLFVWTRPQDGRRQLTLLGNGISDRQDLLVLPGREPEVARAMGAWLAADARWDACDWRDLPAGSSLATLDLGACALDRLEEETPCPARPLPAMPEAVVGDLPRKRRENLRRRERRLAELGALDVETADEASRAEILQALFRLHAARWAERGEAGVLAEVEAFHARASAALLADGLLQLQALRLDGRIVAVHYGMRRGQTAYSYIHGFDPALAAHGPSALLIAAAMETAVGAGARRFDFLRGQEPYKYDWGAQDQRQVRRRVER